MRLSLPLARIEAALLFSSLPLIWGIPIFVTTAAAVWPTVTRRSYIADAMILAVVYGLAFFLLKKFEGRSDWRSIDLPSFTAATSRSEKVNSFHSTPLRALVIYSVMAAVMLLVYGTLPVGRLSANLT